MSESFDVEGEVIAEEDAVGPDVESPVRAIEPYREASSPSFAPRSAPPQSRPRAALSPAR